MLHNNFQTEFKNEPAISTHFPLEKYNSVWKKFLKKKLKGENDFSFLDFNDIYICSCSAIFKVSTI